MVPLHLSRFIGVPLNGFLYGVDFEQYRGLARIMVATGGLY